MAFRSHFRNPPSHHDEESSRTSTKASTRIPSGRTTSGKDDAAAKPAKATQHVSRLAKRASKSMTTSDKVENGTKNTGKAPTSATAAPVAPAVAKKAPVTQTSEVAPAAGHTSSRRPRNDDLLPPPAIRTPSLVSGSSASTFDSPRSNGLHHRAPSTNKHVVSKSNATPSIRSGDTVMHKRETGTEAFDNTVLGIAMPHKSGHDRTQPSAPQYGGRLSQDYHFAGRTDRADHTPNMPHYAPSVTPSTRYTDSPFSHVPTPSSASSYSPGVNSLASASSSRLRHPSPSQSKAPAHSRFREQSKTPSSASRIRDETPAPFSQPTVPSTREAQTQKQEIPRKTATAPPADEPRKLNRQASRARLVKERPQKATNAPATKPVQAPPELAHLNVDLPKQPDLNKPLPPRRPSRDGTPTLTGIRDASPVVQSDLPYHYTTYHKRTPSQEVPASPSSTSRFGAPAKPSAQNSPRVDSAISTPATPATRSFARTPVATQAALEAQAPPRKPSPAVGPSESPKKTPRFGWLSRKSKDEGQKTAEKPKRQPRKGPVAGTGHEGYGRFGFRGRSGSTTPSNGHRSPSADSNASSKPKKSGGDRKSSVGSDGSELDDFLRERLQPRVLRGSGSNFNRVASNSDSQRPFTQDLPPQDALRHQQPALLPSAINRTAGALPSKHSQPSSGAPSDSEDESYGARQRLAEKPSYTRLSRHEDGAASRALPPITTSFSPPRARNDSYDADASTLAQTEDSSVPSEAQYEGREGLWLRPRTATPKEEQARKWNFFQRAHVSPAGRSGEAHGKRDEFGVTSQTHAHRGAHRYAPYGSADPVALDEVERMMQENDTSAEDSAPEGMPARMVPYERRHTSLLPSPPKPDFSLQEESGARASPPRINIRRGSSGSSISPEVMRAQKVTTRQLPNMVEFPKSPTPEKLRPQSSQEMMRGTHEEAPWARAQSAIHTPEMTQGPFGSTDTLIDISPQRQPRLSPVGRIPQVVSRRDRDRKLSDNSFSRPFARTQPRPAVKPPGSLYSQIRELASPIEGGSQPVSSTSTRSDGVPGEHKSSVTTNPASVSTGRTSIDMQAGEFFSFPFRKGSDNSYSSSSGYGSFVAPRPNQEDDVWNEYNDLLDDVMTQKTPLSAGSSFGAPFQYTDTPLELNSPAIPSPLTFGKPPKSHDRGSVQPQKDLAVLSVPQQIRHYMQPSMSPLTPQSLSDLIDQYGKGRSSTTRTHSEVYSTHMDARASELSQNRASAQMTRSADAPGDQLRTLRHKRSTSLPESNARSSQASFSSGTRFSKVPQLPRTAEANEEGDVASANLRFGALMTSKWLSFGRVLFSPAHNEMRLADEPRVLIVDGLGSDWSYYVALSYPAATVYNLGPSPSTWPGVSEKPPTNHRHINQAAISGSFPFPKGFFTAVVLRFPIATTDQAYHSCIFECKRVLRPGGHLEVAVLDLDLMNMGSRARRAVRGLKTRMQQKTPDVSLRNLSDVLVRLIGRRGFEEVQRCVVGVPAAGRIPRSQDISSVSSRDSNGAMKPPSWRREDRHSKRPEFSFADLLDDTRQQPPSHPANARADDGGITKMVAKVGRWWYSSCYEQALLRAPDSGSGDASIWHDRALLRECEKQGTSFRLLICCAQKPVQGKRRTMSV